MLDSFVGRATHPSAFLSHMMPLQLPQFPSLVLWQSHFDVAAYDDALFDRYDITFPMSIRNAVVKRRAEYFAGRFLCYQLLQQRGLPPQVASGKHRQPLWPAGWIGSISHSGNNVVVTLAEQGAYRILGLDLEGWISPSQAAEVQNLVAVPGELERLVCDGSRAHRLTLVFSAKESLFKALYPSVGRYFDFDCAQLLKLDASAKRFTIVLRCDLEGGWMAGQKFEGAWLTWSDRVLTVIAGEGGRQG